MATGTKIYNKNQLLIYPETDAAVVISNASGFRSNVLEDLKQLFERIATLDGSTETINSIIIEVRYLPANTTKVDEIKISTREWSDTFELPTEENPYIWKRTKYTFKGANESDGITTYEIIASDISTIIQTIYTRVANDEITPTIEYKQKTNDKGLPLFIDSSGKETTENTGKIAYDYDYYWNGNLATKMDSLPPAPDGQDYTWTDYPQDISQSYTAVFMSRRIKQGGKWGPFSTPAQYGQWPSNTI